MKVLAITRMKVLAVIGVGLLLVISGIGCRCRELEDAYGDVIDDIGQCEPNLDFLYRPALDPLRIGEPDWCRCRLNRLLCRDVCDDGYTCDAAVWPSAADCRHCAGHCAE